ncbi:MAG TPA: hypothetical protein VF857_04730, partial [Spirochaetota bacterium]
SKGKRGNILCIIGGIAGLISLLFPLFTQLNPEGPGFIRTYEYIREFLLTNSGFIPLVLTLLIITVFSLYCIISGGVRLTSIGSLVLLSALWATLFFSHIPFRDYGSAVYILSASFILESIGSFFGI